MVYRDGFLVWWVRYRKDQFFYVDFNKTKPSTKRYTIKTKSGAANRKFLETPVYALGGGILVYTMNSRERARDNQSLVLVKIPRPVS